jgi:hypothetical protein
VTTAARGAADALRVTVADGCRETANTTSVTSTGTNKYFTLFINISFRVNIKFIDCSRFQLQYLPKHLPLIFLYHNIGKMADLTIPQPIFGTGNPLTVLQEVGW